MPAVETNKLAKSYKKVEALKPLDLAIEPGEIFGLVGPDGAGKTTAIKLLASLLRPTSGRAGVFGFDTASQPEAVRSQIGYMSQSFALYPELTVRENLDFFADIYRVKPGDKKTRLQELMDFSRLGPFRDRLAGKLSGGMKQKLAVSCALIHTPRLLLLDEPTTGIDPISRRELWKLLYDIWKGGVTIVVATPYMDEAERCGRVALMDGGRMLLCDTPEHLKSGLGLEVIEADHEEPTRIQELIAAWNGVDGIHRFGRLLHLHLGDPSVQRPKLEAALRGTGARLRRIEPSLEDVFLAMTGR
ncbi:MAG TPA: multidrug ABC transporter ATP-binding protein [candidate division Zixibacteria bacterium]|nr:multidrug ABC transporter ATP-binding protein [candidate division Zixibacteria bacterium]